MLSLGRPALTVGVRNILIATIGVYVLQLVPGLGRSLLDYGALVPYLSFSKLQIWRLVSYMFLHDPGGPWHLLFNMLALWMFGLELEGLWGTRRFTLFYFLTGICAGLLSFFMWHASIIGASGAVLAVLTVYAYYFPNRQVLMFFIFPVPVRWAVVIIGFISIAGSMGAGGGVAHLTHLGGIVAALVYLKAYDPVMRWFGERDSMKREKTMRSNAEQRISRQRYFEDVIDPILKKISQEGMESLTKEEQKLLEKASKTNREDLKKSKILPFDFLK